MSREAAPAPQDTDDLGPHLGAIPEYPTDAIPGPLGDLIRAAEQAGLPVPLVAGAGLGVASTIAMRAQVEVGGDTWVEPTTVWIPLIAPPGGAKSPSMRFATRILDHLEAEAHRAYRDELKGWRGEPAEDREEPPLDPTLSIDDATLEALARQLDTSGGTTAAFVDELRGFLAGIGQYKKGGGGDLPRYLSLWDGARWRYKRVGSGRGGGIDILIERPVAPIIGGIQPQYSELLGPEEDGMRARWLPHLSMATDLEPTSARTPQTWEDLVRYQYARQIERTWTLHHDGVAYGIWKSARQRWREASRSDTVTPSVQGALGKSDRYAARIALIIAETLDPGRAGEIPPEAMTAAVTIVDYCLDCWRALPERGDLQLDRKQERLAPAVERLAAWLEARRADETGVKRTRFRDAQMAKVAGARNAATFRALAHQYEMTYPGSVREEPSPTGRSILYLYPPTRSVGKPRSVPSRSAFVTSMDAPPAPKSTAPPPAPGSGLVPCRTSGCTSRVHPDEYPEGWCSACLQRRRPSHLRPLP